MANFNFNIENAVTFEVTQYSFTETECASQYTYKVTAPDLSDITFSLQGNSANPIMWISQSYQSAGVEYFDWSGTDLKTIVFDTELYISFVLDNSGDPGRFNNAKIVVTNNTFEYTDNVVRENDSLPCDNPTGEIKTYDELTDTPDNKTGSALKLVRVNATEDGHEYVDASTYAGSSTLQNVLDNGTSWVSGDGFGTFEITPNDGNGEITYNNTDENWGYTLNAEEGLLINQGASHSNWYPRGGFDWGDGTYTLSVAKTTLTDNRNIYFPDESGTLALTSDLDSLTLQNVIDNGDTYNIGDDSWTWGAKTLTHLNKSDDFGMYVGGEEGLQMTDGSGDATGRSSFSADGVNIGNYTVLGSIRTSDITDYRTLQFPDASGTIALTSDIDSYSEWATYSGTRIGGDLSVIIGDYDDSSRGTRIIIDDNNQEFKISSNGNTASIDLTTLSSDITLYLPYTSGTLALTSQVGMSTLGEVLTNGNTTSRDISMSIKDDIVFVDVGGSSVRWGTKDYITYDGNNDAVLLLQTSRGIDIRDSTDHSSCTFATGKLTAIMSGNPTIGFTNLAAGFTIDITSTTPTADRTQTLQDADGTIALTSDIPSSTDTSEWATYSGTRANGDLLVTVGDYDVSDTGTRIIIDQNGETVSVKGTLDIDNGTTIKANSGLYLENAAGTSQSTISATNLTAFRNLELPDASGTIALTDDFTLQAVTDLGNTTTEKVAITPTLTATSGANIGLEIDATTTETGAFNYGLNSRVKHTGSNKGSYNYGAFNRGEMAGTNGYDGAIWGGYQEARYSGSGTNATWSSLYGTQSRVRVTNGASGDIDYAIGSNISTEMESANTDIQWMQGSHTNVTLTDGTVSGSIAIQLLDFDYTAGTVANDLAYLQIQADGYDYSFVSGNARAINSDSSLPSSFRGDIILRDDNYNATLTNSGTQVSDITLTLPSSSGTIALTDDIDAIDTSEWATYSGTRAGGDLDITLGDHDDSFLGGKVNITTTTVNFIDLAIQTNNGIEFVGNSFSGTLAYPEWTSARTLTLPDDSGTLALTSDIQLPWIDITKAPYNAVADNLGNAGVDSTTAWNDALDALETAGGGTLYIPYTSGKRFNITNLETTTRDYSNITITSFGKGRIFVKESETGVVISRGVLVNIATGTDGFEISNLDILVSDGASRASFQTGVICSQVGGISNVTIDNCIIKNETKLDTEIGVDGVNFYRDVTDAGDTDTITNLTIKNCTIDLYGQSIYGINSTRKIYNTRIENNTIELHANTDNANEAYNAIGLYGDSEYFNIIGNRVLGSGHSAIGVSMAENGVVAYNYVYDVLITGEAGIEVEYKDSHGSEDIASNGVKVVCNYVYNCNYGILVTERGDSATSYAPYNILIDGNTIKDSVVNDIFVVSSFAGSTDYKSQIKDVIISNNYIDSTTTDGGIRVYDAKDVKIIGNIIKNMANGIKIGRDSSIYPTGNYDIINNNISDVTDVGIYIESTRANFRINNNNIINPTGKGMFLFTITGGDNWEVNNNFVDGATDGYSFYAGRTILLGSVLTGNRAINCSSRGFLMQFDSSIIKNNISINCTTADNLESTNGIISDNLDL